MVVVRIPAEAAAVRADTVVGTVDTDVTTTCEAAHGLIWATRYIVTCVGCSREKAIIGQSDSTKVRLF